MLPRLSNNIDLPELPFWQARSFWAQVLLALSVWLNAQGIDLFGLLRELGIGGTPDEVIATGERLVSVWQQLAPILFGLWAWIERRAPNYRLVFWRRSEPFDLSMLGAFALAALLSLAAAPQASAAQCGPAAAVRDQLNQRWRETSVGFGTAANGQEVELFVSRETRTWTMVVTLPDGRACILASGTNWGQPGEQL